MTELRVACIHGRYDSHEIEPNAGVFYDERTESCPGGREVTGLPIAWCFTHSAVRDHHVETEQCDVPRSLLVGLDAGTGDTE